MTIVVAFLCTDGVVVAADSMVSHGDMALPYRSCKKIQILRGNQICAFAGDLSFGARFWSVANRDHTAIGLAADQDAYPRLISHRILEEFQSTRLIHPTNTAQEINFGLETVLAYVQGDVCRCCLFDMHMQFRLLTEDYFYQALGSGALSAGPFLHFLVKDVFCHKDGPLINVRVGELIAIWTIEHVISTNAGGVGGPIQVATLKHDSVMYDFVAHDLPASEKFHWDYKRDIEDALQALRDWKDRFLAADQDSFPLPNKKG